MCVKERLALKLEKEEREASATDARTARTKRQIEGYMKGIYATAEKQGQADDARRRDNEWTSLQGAAVVWDEY